MLNSISETNGLTLLSKDDQNIYSVGISTAGLAEIQMVKDMHSRHVIASTIDTTGASFTRKKILEEGLSNKIEVKIENTAEPLPYQDSFFDFIYARLVLHYLKKNDLEKALRELHRILKKNGKAFIVVRAKGHLAGEDLPYNKETGLTTYSAENGSSRSRYFHDQESISKFLTSAGFYISHVKTYEEHLCLDFQRTKPEKQIASLIEVFASKN
jgi:ubiquinone/menaquinone biosynthesis C-methylase UbiE